MREIKFQGKCVKDHAISVLKSKSTMITQSKSSTVTHLCSVNLPWFDFLEAMRVWNEIIALFNKEAKRHPMRITTRGFLWRVDVRMSVDPDYKCIWECFAVPRNAAQSEAMVPTQHKRNFILRYTFFYNLFQFQRGFD